MCMCVCVYRFFSHAYVVKFLSGPVIKSWKLRDGPSLMRNLKLPKELGISGFITCSQQLVFGHANDN